MKVIIADSLPDSAASLLRDEGWTVDARVGRPLEELLRDIADADALIVRSATKVDAALIAAAPHLRVVARAGTGVDNVDLEAASKRGILVMNAPGANSVSVAEHACALMLALSRSIAVADAQMKDGRWEKHSLSGSELRGKVLGIVGFGRIGREVARRARAFEMRIIAHDPFISAQIASDLAVRLVSLKELYEEAYIITLHVPSSDNSEPVIGSKQLTLCKKGVQIINTARGDLIDEQALSEAIQNGQVGGAGLDVFDVEPPTTTSLTGLPGVVATPHIAASTREAQELVGVETATCVRDFLKSGVVRNAVNFASVPAEEFRRLQPYITLAERLGGLLAQINEDRIEAVGVRYYGDLANQGHAMLVGAVLVGLFRPVLSSAVTVVNARSIAEQRGIEVVESQSSRSRNFTSLISVKLHTDKGERWVEGAVFAPNEPRLVLLDGVAIEATVEGELIVIENNDQPGVIGEVGTILGRRDVNIAQFALGRGASGAIGVVGIGRSNIGTSLPESVLAEIQQVAAVRRAHLVRLS